MRARASGNRLDDADAALVKGMIARGDRQHDIAAWFGVNGGRIAEIANGTKFKDIVTATDGLPPSGPYTSGRSVEKARKQLAAIKEALQGLAKDVEEQIKNLK